MKRAGWVAAAVAVVVALVGLGVAATDPFHRTAAADPDSDAALSTAATVTRGTLTAQAQQNGTLGYAGDYPVVAHLAGTATWLPAVGQVIRQGHVLYRVDGRPVVLLHGAGVPLYRPLSEGSSGPDVRELNAALRALGYTAPHSAYFTAATEDAVERLQHRIGVTETGGLGPEQAVFLPTAAARIVSRGPVRDGPVQQGATVLQASSTDRQVTVSLDAAAQTQVAAGDHVSITMPSGATTPGVVSSVGKVAVAGSGDAPTTVTVRIRPTRPAQTGALDQAPVQVTITTARVADALAVPVNALLALAGGGYAVELVGAGGVRTVLPVTVGLFDDSAGTVQVSGTGLAAGQHVVAAA